MTIISRDALQAQYALARAAGRTPEAAVAHVAEAFGLDVETVREAVQEQEGQEA